MIEIKQLQKANEHTTLLDIDELYVKDGEITAVVGQGELTFFQLVCALKEKLSDFENIEGIVYEKDGVIVKNTPRSAVSLDDFPLLPFHLLD